MKDLPRLTVREALEAVGLLKESESNELLAVDLDGIAEDDDRFSDAFRQLNANFNYRNLMKVLNYPIWGGKGRQVQETLRRTLLDLGHVSDGEMLLALDSDPPSGRGLAALLIEHDIVEPAVLSEAREKQRGSGDSLWKVLVSEGWIEPQKAAQLLRRWNIYRHRKDAETFLLELLEVMEILGPDKEVARSKRGKKKGKGSGFGSVLSAAGGTKERILELLEPFLDLVFEAVDTEAAVESDLLLAFPLSALRELRFLPLERRAQKLTVGLVDPRLFPRLKELREASRFQLEPVLIRPGDWRRVLKKWSNQEHRPRRELKDLVAASQGQTSEAADLQSPAVKMARSILEAGLEAQATDIHLEPTRERLRVRFRLDGRLHDVMSVPKGLETEVLSRIKILANMDIAEKRRPQDGHFSLHFEGSEFNLRVATLPTYRGEKLVLRVLDETNVLRGLGQIGFEREERERFEQLIYKPHGMLLVTGPMGSGKSTTLYSALSCLNTAENNVVTIEDPVEYELKGINQVQVEPEIGVTFAAGLRAVLRQDADILMVGEIRDQETAKVATWAALTGHLVLCTLHTNDATSAVTMLCSLGVERYVVAGALIGVVAQRLVRQLCPDCKEPYPPPSTLLREIGLEGDVSPTLYRAKGCNFCFHTGFRGRTGVFELLGIDDEMRQMIMRDATEQKLRQQAIRTGTQTLRQNGLRKILDGKSSVEEVMREIEL